MAVLGISMAARSAIEGGIPTSEILLKNDLLLKQLSECKNIEEIHELEAGSFIYFADLVRKNRQKEIPNKYVNMCKNIIAQKRFEKISGNELAIDLGLSREYLNKIFLQYEGVGLSEYIVQVKLEAACNMLKYSDRTISEIAEYLSFGSGSNFSSIFKRKMKKTPREYRNENSWK